LSQPILGERVRRKDWIATLASVVGMGLFFRGEIDATGKIGNVVAMLSSFGFAGLPLAIRSEERALAATGQARPESPVVAMILGNVIATAACLPVMAGSPPHVGVELGALVALGALQIALPYLLYGIAVRALSALESSLVAMIEPVLSPVWVLFATGERPSRDAILGGAIILAAVLFRSVSRTPPTSASK
jgi:drug/metabolite transporter (DMT)-like permease